MIEKLLKNYEIKVLAGMVKFNEKRFTWLNVIDETFFLSHENKMIYYTITKNKEATSHNMLIEIENDGIKNNYKTLDFVDYVDMMGMFCNEDDALFEIIRFKEYRDLKDRFNSIDPFDPQQEQIEALYVEASKKASNVSYVSAKECFNILGKEMQAGSESVKPKYTGLKEYDDLMGGILEGLDVISGRAGAGKTSLAMVDLMMYAETNPKENSVFFSGEVGIRSLSHKVTSFYSKLDITRIKAHLFTESDFIHFCDSAKMAVSNCFFIECNGISTNEAKQIIKKIEKETGRKVGRVCFDYLQIMTPNDKKTRSEAEWFGRISGDLREFSKLIPTIAVSNLVKEKDNATTCPNIGELKGSSQIEYDASRVLMLWRPSLEKTTTVCTKVVKNRFGEAFKSCTWKFTGENGTFLFDQDGEPDTGKYGKAKPKQDFSPF